MTTSPLAGPAPWDLVAEAYTSELTPAFEHYAAHALRHAKLPDEASILDIACGPGTLAMLAARAGHVVIARDISPKMIAALEARAADEKLTGLVHAQLGNGMDLGLPSKLEGTFQGAFSMFGLMFFPDRKKGLAEMHRALATGAPAVISSWVPADRVPALSLVFATLRELRPPPPGTPPFVPPLASITVCTAEMTNAGFHDVEVIESVHSTAFASTKDLWASLVRTSAPLALVKSQIGDDAWTPIANAIEERLVAAFGEGPQELTLPAYLTFGRR